MSTHRVVRLRSRPQGAISDTDLELTTEPKPTLDVDGKLLIRNLYTSIDPTHRIWMSDRPQYMPPVVLGDVMRSVTLGVVEESKNADYPVGTHAVCFGGIAEYFIGTPGENVLYKVEATNELPLTAHLSVVSVVIGLTAWHGVAKILQPKAGDILVVSGAAGAVGSLVGQLAKQRGAKTIGIAGSADKCKQLIDEFGFDHAINYKTDNVEEKIKAFAPEGINHYFDNVGGAVTDAVLQNFKNFGRFAFCGAISEYDDVWSGQKNFNMLLMRRVTLTGYICTDHIEEIGEAVKEISELVSQGKVKYHEDIREGIENYASTVRLLSSGGNTGKLLLKLH